VNPCGRTKLFGEQMLADVAAVTQLRHVSLRYSNVVGAGRQEWADRGAAYLCPSSSDS
jgi:UDP-glucose 4-epimerase